MNDCLHLRAFTTFAFATLIIACTTNAAELAKSNPEQEFERQWEYPKSSSGSGVSRGMATFFTLELRTEDSIEDVAIWYAKRVGLSSDHELIKKAKVGFGVLDTGWGINTIHDGNTSGKKTHTVVLGDFSRAHGDLTIVHQPNLRKKTDVFISITQRDEWTSIKVLQQHQEDG